MRRSVVGLATGAVAVALGTGGCAFTTASPASSSSSPAVAGTDAAALARVAAASVDLVGVHGLDGTEAAGTGIVLTPGGEVLTNNHVISGATSLTAVDVGNGRSYTATVLGYDRSHDLALVQLHGASGLKTVPLAVDAAVRVGDAVTALGNAGGRGGQPSAASGSVTALDQQIVATDQANGSSEQLSGLIQVNAPIQAGDSGGPLANGAGQVIGIDTAASVGYRFRSAPTEGYAVPAAQAQTTADAIAAGRASSTVHIGATAWLGVSVSASGTGGAQIVQVVSGSPAASLRGPAPGDVITSLDGARVTDATTLTTLLDRHHPGDTVTLGWTDAAGQSRSAALRLGTGPAG